MTDSTKKEAALAFLKSHDLAMLATVSAEGQPRARLVYYASDEAFNIYFLSLANTRKVADIRANPKAAMVISSDDKQHTLQLEGTFEEMTDTATFGPIITELSRHLFPEAEPAAPITHLDKDKPVFYKLAPTWIRWGDFTLGDGTAEVFAEIAS
jgi:general stress protein 26